MKLECIDAGSLCRCMVIELVELAPVKSINALEDHEGTVCIGGRTITNLHFADDVDGLAGEEELAKLVEHLDKASTA